MYLGTDIVEIERIKEAAQRQDRFAPKILAEEEFLLYQAMPPSRKYSFLAGRFSAKEAYGKALGTGIGSKLKFTDITILPNQQGVPTIKLAPITHPAAIVSISHSRENAIATVIINTDPASMQQAIDALRKN